MSNIDYKNIYLYDHNFTPKGIIDTYTSMIWTERYNDIGDCELVIPMNASIAEQIKLGDYVELIEKSDEFNSGRNIMMVNYINIKNDMENNHIIIKGQDETRILKQRAILFDYEMSADETYLSTIKTLINDSMKNNYKYLTKTFGLDRSGVSVDLPIDLKVEIPKYWEDYPYKGSGSPFHAKSNSKSFILHSGTVFDAVKTICDICNWGFKIVWDDNHNLTLSIYCGKRHDGTEINETAMTFAMEFDNLISSELIIDAQTFANRFFLLGDKYDAPDYDTINDNKKSIFKRNQKVSRFGQLYESLKDDNADAPSVRSDNWRRIPWHPIGLVYNTVWPGNELDSRNDMVPLDTYDDVTHVNVKDYYEDTSKQPDPNSDNRVYISNADLSTKLQKDLISTKKVWLWKRDYKPEIRVSDKYTYKKDYALGDLVTYIDKFAGTFTGRITEFTRTLDDQGYREFPTIKVEE